VTTPLRRTFRPKVASDPDTKDSPVAVAAKEGRVTLTGKVTTPVAQQKVEQVAREELGMAAIWAEIIVGVSAIIIVWTWLLRLPEEA
jgi:osmotically-inducible protein OsmY